MSFNYINFREIDKLGRVVIPMQIRRKLGINAGDMLKISAEDGLISVTKAEESCIFCGSTDQLVDYEGKKVCSACIAKLRDQTVKL